MTLIGIHSGGFSQRRNTEDGIVEEWVELFSIVASTARSDAWGQEDEYELACFEADAFDEPRPHW